MQHSNNTKDAKIKVTCYYDEAGRDVSKILRESFSLFVKSELVRLCG